MGSKVIRWIQCMLLMLVVSSCTANGFIDQLTLGDGPWYRSFESGQLYNFSVNAASPQEKFSAHIFQVHAAEHVTLTLRNTSKDCNSTRECSTTGTHIGLVQLHSYSTFSSFSVKHSCVQERENCSATQLVLVAVVGIPVNDPIPGGCSMTSALELEASLSEANVNDSFILTFQDSDVGYDPQIVPPPPCTDQFKFVTRLEYKVYQQCVPYPTINSTFSAIERMISIDRIDDDIWQFPFKTLSYSAAKKVTYYATQQQGVVLNVVARDTKFGTTSAYIPSVSLNCDFSTGQCASSLSAITWVCAVVVGIIGLYLCLLGHRFFHIEVFLFTLLISVYIMYMVLLSLTDWDGLDLAVGVAGCGLVLTILFFLLWFFTNSLFLFLTLFGCAMGFIITSTILYTPLGSYELVKVTYIYILILLSGLFLWMLPFVFYSSVLNIVSSAVVGSYTITFGIGLIVRSSFTDIVLRVARNAAIPGYLSVSSFCAMSDTDAILLLAWIVMCVMSITIQVVIEIFRRRSFKRRQALVRKFTRTDSDLVEPVRRQYNAFPSTSLFKQMRRFATRRTRYNAQFPPSSDGNGGGRGGRGERRPLLSPSKLQNKWYT